MNHIAQVIPGLDRIGGAERQAILLAMGLRQRGWRVSMVMLSGSGGAAARELSTAGIDCITLGMRKGLADPRGWFRFNRWLRRSRPDVVHTHLPHAAWLARWSRLAAPVPVLVDTLHSSFPGKAGRHLGYRLSNFLADQVTAVSEAAAGAHLAVGMVSRDRLIVLPNAVDPEKWRPNPELRAKVRRELGLANEFLWIAAGRLEPVKDYPTLLRAMALLPPPARLAIAGSGVAQAALTALSAQLGLSSRVRFFGFAPDLERWMQAADAFVLSSLWEGLPTALMEASACGLPAVATDVPGVSEVIPDSPLVPPRNPQALAAAMIALMQTPAQARLAMGLRARQFAIERFALQSVLNRWEALYASLLHHAPNSDALIGIPSSS